VDHESACAKAAGKSKTGKDASSCRLDISLVKLIIIFEIHRQYLSFLFMYNGDNRKKNWPQIKKSASKDILI